MTRASLQELGKIFFICGLLVLLSIPVLLFTPVRLFVLNFLYVFVTAGFGLILLSFLLLTLGSRIDK